eukprot:TRINITY_DN60154_c0_g1_i1.p1 TRINITY_DN60154_c0_g1~~TRINITY_DN60154_c0_g1_i1.p1  ORF type:complete len:144 (+),score=7.72 TRINITY_DN60154_c0_g1_i1:329-760(+)
MPDGGHDDRLVRFNLEQRDIAAPAERNHKLADPWAVACLAAGERRETQRGDAAFDGVERSRRQCQVPAPREFPLDDEVIQPLQVLDRLEGEADLVVHRCAERCRFLATSSFVLRRSTTSPASTYAPLRRALANDARPRTTNSA